MENPVPVLFKLCPVFGNTCNGLFWLHNIHDTYSCVAFAHFAFWYIFGVADSVSAYSKTMPSDSSIIKLKDVKVGDMVVPYRQ